MRERKDQRWYVCVVEIPELEREEVWLQFDFHFQAPRCVWHNVWFSKSFVGLVARFLFRTWVLFRFFLKTLFDSCHGWNENRFDCIMQSSRSFIWLFTSRKYVGYATIKASVKNVSCCRGHVLPSSLLFQRRDDDRSCRRDLFFFHSSVFRVEQYPMCDDFICDLSLWSVFITMRVTRVANITREGWPNHTWHHVKAIRVYDGW